MSLTRVRWRIFFPECLVEPFSCSMNLTIPFGQVKPWLPSTPWVCAICACAVSIGIHTSPSQKSSRAASSKLMTIAAVREVPFFAYPSLFKAHEAEFVNIFRDIGRRGAFIKQKDLQTFESRLASYLNIAFALGVGNATDGLEVALLAAGIGPGEEVILSSHTMLATAVAAHFAGATPVPVDCGADHLIDPQAVEAAITSRTRAIMPTQLNGRTRNMDVLGSIASNYGLLVVEGAALALGSRFNGRCAATFGVSAAISFYPAKLLGCFGDGGAVVTDNREVYDPASELCNFGRNATGNVVRWGFNSRLDNLQAAILNLQFDQYEQVVSLRRHIATLYVERCGTIGG